MISKLTINQIINKAAISNKEGKLEEAEKLCKLALKIEASNPVINYNLGIVLLGLGKLDESEVIFKKVILLKPDMDLAYHELTNLYIKLNKYKDAEITLKKLIQINPENEVAHNNLGNMMFKFDKLKEAQLSYKKAIKLKPNFAEAYINIGNLMRELEKLDEAEANYKKAIEVNSNFIEAHYNLAATVKQLSKFNDAEKSFSKALELNPKYEKALLGRGQLLFEKGEFELALRDFDNCNTNESRARSLSSLYSLGRIEEIYQRIKKNNELDDKNLQIAAFSSFIAAKVGKDTANNFCKKPISFINFSNLSAHVENSNSFILDVTDELKKNIKTRWEPLGKTTRNGFHSGGKVNIFDNPLEKMNYLKSIIMDELDSYYSKFKSDNSLYIKKWPLQKKIKGWYVVLKQQGYQTPHMHPSGWLSGVIYLKVVPSLERNEGAIEFSLNGEFFSDPNTPKLIYQPKVGDIILFPSSLHHKTIPFTTDLNRMIIAFDLAPN